jgi:MFS superfamily sulfate permease-like transporter
VITLVGFMESVAVGKVYARRHRYDIDANQELSGSAPRTSVPACSAATR